MAVELGRRGREGTGRTGGRWLVVFLAPAEPENVEAMAALLEEMDRFYGPTETDSLDRRARQIREAVFSDPPPAQVLLAWDERRLVGIAAYSFLWPAVGLTRSLFLKELYVARDHWRRVSAGS